MQQLEYVSVVSSWPKWCRNLRKAHLSIWRPYLLIEGLNARNRILQWTLTLFVIISCISNSNSCNCAMCTEFILCIMWRCVNIVKMCEYCEDVWILWRCVKSVKMCEYCEDVWILWTYQSKCQQRMAQRVSGRLDKSSEYFQNGPGLQFSSAETWTGSHFKTPPSLTTRTGQVSI